MTWPRLYRSRWAGRHKRRVLPFTKSLRGRQHSPNSIRRSGCDRDGTDVDHHATANVTGHDEATQGWIKRKCRRTSGQGAYGCRTRVGSWQAGAGRGDRPQRLMVGALIMGAGFLVVVAVRAVQLHWAFAVSALILEVLGGLYLTGGKRSGFYVLAPDGGLGDYLGEEQAGPQEDARHEGLGHAPVLPSLHHRPGGRRSVCERVSRSASDGGKGVTRLEGPNSHHLRPDAGLTPDERDVRARGLLRNGEAESPRGGPGRLVLAHPQLSLKPTSSFLEDWSRGGCSGSSGTRCPGRTSA